MPCVPILSARYRLVSRNRAGGRSTKSLVRPQAVQGRAVNRAIVNWATPEFDLAVAAGVAYLASSALTFGHEMIQFHGGMGVTEELAIGQAHKRLMMLTRWPLSPEVAMEQYASLLAA